MCGLLEYVNIFDNINTFYCHFDENDRDKTQKYIIVRHYSMFDYGL